MGYVVHDALVITGWAGDNEEPKFGRTDWPSKVEAIRAQQVDPRWRALLVGPIDAVINGDISYVLLPDGSKEDWDESNHGDELRARLIEALVPYVEEGWVSYAVVHFGGDEAEDKTRVTEASGFLIHPEA